VGGIERVTAIVAMVRRANFPGTPKAGIRYALDTANKGCSVLSDLEICSDRHLQWSGLSCKGTLKSSMQLATSHFVLASLCDAKAHLHIVVVSSRNYCLVFVGEAIGTPGGPGRTREDCLEMLSANYMCGCKRIHFRTGG